MTRVLTNNKNYYDIADAIRQMKNVSTTYKPRQMASALKDIYSNEVEGVPPLTFESNGMPLIDYRIDGASGGVGKKTKNLFNPSILVTDYHLEQNSGLPSYFPRRCATGQPISINCNSLILQYKSEVENTLFMYSLFSDNTLIRRVTGNVSGATIDTTGANKIYFSFYAVNETVTPNNLSEIMLSENNIVYEPYGYKVPVVCGGITTNIYLDKPIEAKANIPSEYTEVEYIESTGTQYINTNIIPTNTTGLEAKISICNDNNRDNVIVGCRETTSGENRYWIDVDWSGNDTIIFGFNTNTNINDRYSLKDSDVGKSFIISMNYMNDRTGKINGITYDTSISSKTLVSISNSLYIFAGNRSGTAAYYYSGKLYNLKITDGTNVIKNFVPCYRKSDNVAGLYDLVNNVFYTNQGTGNFIIGPIKENESISLSDTNTNIPTIEGTNVLTIDTTVQPSNVYVQARKDPDEIVDLTTILEEEI